MSIFYVSSLMCISSNVLLVLYYKFPCSAELSQTLGMACLRAAVDSEDPDLLEMVLGHGWFCSLRIV